MNNYELALVVTAKIEVTYADNTTSDVQITNAMVTDNATGTAVNIE